MQKISLLIAVSLPAFALHVLSAGADTIFDVEHARAMYRAGVASRYDMEQLRRYGRPSGFYPQYGPPRPRRIDLRRLWRRERYYDRYDD